MPMVEIEKPADEPLGDWFQALRNWIDRNGCGSSVTFTRVGQGEDRLIYRLAFADGALATKFSRTFAVYLAREAESHSDKLPEFVTVDVLGEALA